VDLGCAIPRPVVRFSTVRPCDTRTYLYRKGEWSARALDLPCMLGIVVCCSCLETSMNAVRLIRPVPGVELVLFHIRSGCAQTRRRLASERNPPRNLLRKTSHEGFHLKTSEPTRGLCCSSPETKSAVARTTRYSSSVQYLAC
jgi:hypothetical protein